jgi:hypothetical protein
MRRLALIITILGLFTLLLILNSQQPTPIESSDQLQNITENGLIQVSGIVIKETYNQNSRSLTLSNNLKLTCACKDLPSLKGRNIEATAIIERFNNQETLEVLEIKIN